MKTDYKNIKDTERQADLVLRKLSSASKLSERIDNELEFSLRNYHIDQIEEILKGMDIEKISSVTPGLRIPLLRENGIQTVNDLFHTDEAALIAVNGIGPDTASKLMRSLNFIVRSISMSLPVRLSPENPDSRILQLLRAVRMKMMLEKDSERCRKLNEWYAGDLKEYRKTLQTVRSGFRWFFTRSKMKAQIAETAEKADAVIKKIASVPETFQLHYKKEEALTDQEILEDFRKNAPSYYAVLENCRPEPDLEEIPDRVAAEVSSLTLHTENLHAVLRHYQEFGAKYIVTRKRTLLADEMGLGKTVEAIAAAVHLQAEGKTHFLTVCPLGIIAGWQKEIRRFSDFDPVLIRKKPQSQLEEWIRTGGFAVTNYETLCRLQIPDNLHIDLLIADEAHYVKNPKAARTKAVLRFAGKAERVLYMTGTPLENRPQEMCYLISCLDPEIAEEIRDILFLTEAELFRQKISPVYLRRKREDVLKELPELSRFDAWTDMTESEITAYLKTVAEGNFMAMRRVSWNAHESMKAVRLLELCTQAKEDNRKTVIFSQFLNTIDFVYELLKDECPIPITGAVPPEKRLQIIEDFSSDPDQHFLILQVQSGGIGQNIQSASVVIFCEPQIKPSLENQALSRVYRMGQLNHVFCYRLLSAGSIDERIIEILDDKQFAFDLYADESSLAQSELSALNTKKLIEEEQKKWNLTPAAEKEKTPDLPSDDMKTEDAENTSPPEN